ncbi:hypothetical protein GCM10009864_60750 [Streptomyces lunalinharesii]|uniref:Uncharacterized protein n=1 Tax=Streptomyces lunalinharesii TaxID=333384 RepID=A0ABP6EZH5_9ACTN
MPGADCYPKFSYRSWQRCAMDVDGEDLANLAAAHGSPAAARALAAAGDGGAAVPGPSAAPAPPPIWPTGPRAWDVRGAK